MTLADGVFDPLHAGHLAYLAACARFADPVVVQVSAQTKRVEYLPRADRAALVGALRLVQDVVTYPTTADALRALRPVRYVKGADWQARGVPEQALCDALGIAIVYVPTVTDSSTGRLAAWAAATAAAGVDELQARASGQVAVPFDAAVQGYTAAQRRAIEAEHPARLAALVGTASVLDVGAGPGHFVRLLREQGVNVDGLDPAFGPDDAVMRADVTALRDQAVDVVVCREVLEHIPVREWARFVTQLFRVARQRVYLTTRFTARPRHPYDLTTEFAADPSHITLLPQPWLRALCVACGGVRDVAWETALDWQHKGRVLVYRVGA